MMGSRVAQASGITAPSGGWRTADDEDLSPILATALLIGLTISLFQSVTSIQEQTLSFIPKVLAMAAVLVIGGPWMLNQLLSYTSELWTSIPNMVG